MKIYEITEASKFSTGADSGEYSKFSSFDKAKRLQNISRAGIKIDPQTQGSLIGRASISDVDPEDQTGISALKKQTAADAIQRKKDLEKQEKEFQRLKDKMAKDEFEKKKADTEKKGKVATSNRNDSQYKKSSDGRTLRHSRYYGSKDSSSALAKGIQGFADPRNWKSGIEKFSDNPVDFISSKVDKISSYLNSRY